MGGCVGMHDQPDSFHCQFVATQVFIRMVERQMGEVLETILLKETRLFSLLLCRYLGIRMG